MAMMTLPSGGTTVRNACGSTTMPQRLAERQPDRAGRLGLPGRDGVDAAADGLADERRRVEDQAGDRRTGSTTPLMPSSGSPNAQKNSTTVSGQLRNTLTQRCRPTAAAGRARRETPPGSCRGCSEPDRGHRQIPSVPRKPST